MTITRRRIGVNFKLFCIKQFEKNHNKSRTAKENGVTRATLRNWIKNKKFLKNVKHKRKIIYFIYLFY